MGKKRRSRAFKESDQIINFEDERQKRREKRKQLTEKKKGPQDNVNPVSSRRASKMMKRRLIVGAVCLLILGVVIFSAYNVVTLLVERSKAEDVKLALEKERARLEKEYSLVDSDEYIEEKARGELHMIKQGETIYVLPEDLGSELTGAAIGTTGAAAGTSGALTITEGAVAPLDGMEDRSILVEIKDTIQSIGENLKSLVIK